MRSGGAGESATTGATAVENSAGGAGTGRATNHTATTATSSPRQASPAIAWRRRATRKGRSTRKNEAAAANAVRAVRTANSWIPPSDVLSVVTKTRTGQC